MIVIWNSVDLDVPANLTTTALPGDKLFFVRPEFNSLQNRFLPMDLIRDGVSRLHPDPYKED